jgi:hypothetical protein
VVLSEIWRVEVVPSFFFFFCERGKDIGSDSGLTSGSGWMVVAPLYRGDECGHFGV